MTKKLNPIEEGKQSYEEWRTKNMADPEFRALYEEEAAKKELWLQLVEARQTAGLSQRDLAKKLGVSQAQVARLEKRGSEDYTLNSLRRYIQALGDEFVLEVKVRHRSEEERPFARVEVSR
jgi:ribosome-binding protein aMBF1 (putative translation factor)